MCVKVYVRIVSAAIFVVHVGWSGRTTEGKRIHMHYMQYMAIHEKIKKTCKLVVF